MSDFDYRAEYGFPPKIDDFFGEVSPDSDWDYSLWVQEWAEAYLGSEAFASLESRFATTPGIKRIAHIDREVFLIQSRLTPAEIRQALWPHFVAAAQQRYGADS